MVLPFRSRVSLSAGLDAGGFRGLCEAYGHLIGHRYLDLAPEDDGRVQRFSNISLPEACATLFDQAPSRFRLSRNLGGLDLVVLAIPLPGTELVYEQRGVVLTATAGEAIVYSSAETLHSHATQAGRALAVALPREKLGALLRNDDLTQMRKLPAGNPALTLFRSYAEAWLALDGDTGFLLAETMSDQLCDLAALVIGASGRGREKAVDSRAVRDARYQRATVFIRRNLHRPDLGDRHVAAHLGLSSSSLRQLFAEKATSPGRAIREHRLERAHALLREARDQRRTVLDIALDCGFGSLSAFYRAFRERYGVAPTEIRDAFADTPVLSETR